MTLAQLFVIGYLFWFNFSIFIPYIFIPAHYTENDIQEDSLTFFPSEQQQPVTIEELLDTCLNIYAGIMDYTCILHKTELVDNILIEENDIIFKFKKPKSFFLRWPSGSEAIYVQDRYDNKLRFHSGNIFGFIVFSLDPKGPLAMQDNRHTILEAHLGYMIDLIYENYCRAKKRAELNIDFTGTALLDGADTWIFKALFPEDKGYYGHIITIYVDTKLYLPTKIEVYGWQNELWEMYHFSNLRINTGLTDIDFDTENPDYDF